MYCNREAKGIKGAASLIFLSLIRAYFSQLSVHNFCNGPADLSRSNKKTGNKLKLPTVSVNVLGFLMMADNESVYLLNMMLNEYV